MAIMKNYRITTLLAIIVTAMFTERKAYAYLDPGSGSAMVQAAIAGGLGAVLIIRTYFSKIKGFFHTLTHKTSNNEKTNG